MSDLIVFGTLAGDGAVQYADQMENQPQINPDQVQRAIRGATDCLNREEGPNPYVIHDQLRDLMQDKVGIIRERGELLEAIDGLQALKSEVGRVKAHGSSQYNPGWHEAISLKSLMICSEAVAKAALLREESRGAHTRIDFEGEREEWGKYNIVVRKGNEGPVADKVLRTAPDPELVRVARLTMDELEEEIRNERQS